MKVVIVGGGIAGVSTASALRALGFDGELTLVDAGPFPYERPRLTKDYLAGRAGKEQVALLPDDWYQRQKIHLLTGTEAIAVRPGDGGVELSGGVLLAADRVVLATGGRADRPRGLDLPEVHTLRTIEDADRLRAALVPGARVLVIGAGLIGAETAGTAATLGCDVTLVDPVAVPLAAAMGADLAGWLHDRHRANGVTTVHAGVTSLRARSGGVDAVFTTSAAARTFDVVVLGIGMSPDTRLAATAGLAVDRGIVVDERRRTSNPAVLAVGDSARAAGKPEHWEAAQDDGARAAAAILGRPAPTTRTPWFWTDRHGNHVEVVGRMADAGRTVRRGTLGTVPFAVFGLRGDRMVAAAAVDDSNAIRAARRFIDRGITVDPGELADPSVSLSALLKPERHQP